MDRRALLRRLSVLGAVGTAGCVAAPDSDRGDGSTPGSDSMTLTPMEPPSGTVGAPPADAPFPPGRDDVDAVIWSGGDANGERWLRMEPPDGPARLPEDAVEFTLHNGGDRTFETNFYGWALYRLEDGRWHRVAPTSWPQPLTPLPAGESHAWTVQIDTTDLSPYQFRTQGTTDLSVGPLGGGTYAFAVDGWWADQSATPTYEHQTVAAAAFAVEGDPLELVPSDAVVEATRDGDTVTVTADDPAATDSDRTREGTFVLRRNDEADGGRTLVTERVYRHWPLRDALAHADSDVTEIRVETTTAGVPPFGVQDDEPPVTYDGRTYRVSATAPEL